MTDIVDALKAEANRLDRRAYADRCVGPDCALSSLVAATAAAEIERLRGLYEREHAYGHAQTQLLESAEARLAEAVEMLHRVYFASRIDVLMEGPRLQGWNRPELDRLWPELRDLVAKLEQKP